MVHVNIPQIHPTQSIQKTRAGCQKMTKNSAPNVALWLTSQKRKQCIIAMIAACIDCAKGVGHHCQRMATTSDDRDAVLVNKSNFI